MGYNGYTDKKKLSNQRYLSKVTRASIILTKEEKEMLTNKAKSEGKSLNNYLRNAVGLKDTPMQKDDMEQEEKS